MTYTKDALKEAIQQKLRLNYGCTEKQATDGEIMKACALALRDIMAVRSVDTQERTQEQQEKRVHYPFRPPKSPRRTPRRPKLRGSKCGCRRRRSSCPAG